MAQEEGSLLLWSPDEFNLCRFEQDNKKKLPVIITITQGCMGSGDGDIFDFPNGAVYLVLQVVTQTRAVMQDIDDRCYSIPANYPIGFQVIDKDDKPVSEKSRSLKDIITEVNASKNYPRLLLEDDATVEMYVGSSQESRGTFGILDMIDIYDEMYLVAFTVNEDLETGDLSCLDVPLAIPLYMNLLVRTAWGMQKVPKGQKGLPEIVHRLKFKLKKVDLSQMEINDKIMQLPDDIGEGNYQYIMPKEYINVIPTRKHHNVTTAISAPTYETPKTQMERYPKRSPPPLPKVFPPPAPPRKAKEKTLPRGPVPPVPKEENAIPKPPQAKPPPVPAPIRRETKAVSNQAQTALLSDHPRKTEDAGSKQARAKTPPVPAPRPRPSASKSNGSASGPSAATPNSNSAVTQAAIQPAIRETSARKPHSPDTEAKVAPTAHVSPMSNLKSVTEKGSAPTKHTDSLIYEAVDVINVKPPQKMTTQSLPVMQSSDMSPRYTGNKNVLGIADIPDDLSRLSVGQVAQCLHILKMSEHIHTFVNNDIDGELLISLDRKMLVNDLHLSSLHALKVIQFVQGWRPKT